MNTIKMVLIATAGVVASYMGFAENVVLGFKEVGGVTVAEGVEKTADGKVVIGSDAEFRKAGDGTYVLPSEKLDQNVKSKMVVLDGTLKLQTAATSAEDTDYLGIAASNVMQTAGFWVDETSAVITNVEGEATQFVSKWCDVRETDQASPKLIYAEPYWPKVKETSANQPTATDIPPTLETRDGLTSVYFGGRFSGKTMTWKQNGSAKTLNAYHMFVVHGVYSCWAPIIGHTIRRGGGMLISTGSINPSMTDMYGVHDADDKLQYGTLEDRIDLHYYQNSARWFLDGEKWDPFCNPPKKQFQLLEHEAMGNLFPANSFMDCRFETFVEKDSSGVYNIYKNAPGGDYVAEVLIFTNNLVEADRVLIERYLMRKWNLPYHPTFTSSKSTDPQRNNFVTTTAAAQIAKGATLEVDTASGKDSVPFSYSGEGTLKISGAGQAIVGPTDGRPWSGDLVWDGNGAIVTRGGALPPLDVSAGEKYVVGIAGEKGSPVNQATDAAGGMKLTRSNNAGEGTVEIANVDSEKMGWVRVRKIASDVKKLKANARVVQLQGRVRGDTLVEAAPLEVVITNADFELPFNSAVEFNRVSVNTAGTNGWSTTSSSYYINRIAKENSAKKYWTAWFPTSLYPRGLTGGTLLQIVQDGNAYTTINVPKDGYYELSFDAMSRYGSTVVDYDKTAGVPYNNMRNIIAIKFGSTWASATTMARMTFDCMPMKRYRVKVGPLTAGEQVFGFNAEGNSKDACNFFDNLKMTYIADKEDGRGETALDNGDFEQPIIGASPNFLIGAMTLANLSTGWNLAVDPSSPYYGNAYITNSVVAIVDGGERYKSGSKPTYQQYRIADGKRGCSSLLFHHNYATATKSFDVPAGTYRLKGTISSAPIERNGTYIDAYSYPPEFQAKVTLDNGESVINLGKVSPMSQSAAFAGVLNTQPCYWAPTFTVSTNQTITIEIANTKLSSSGLVDDLVLIDASRGYEAKNLISDAGYELPYLTTTSTSIGRWNHYGYQRYWDHAYPWAYGYNYFPGRRMRACEIQTTGLYQFARVFCTVTAPETGLYRCKTHFRTRADGGYENAEYLVYANKMVSGVESTTTNMIMRFNNFYQRHYHEEEGLVRLEAGEYRFSIAAHNTASTAHEEDIYFDEVSLVKVNETIDDTPEMPDDLKIEVAKGSKLHLDFTGNHKCRNVKYDGKLYLGEISEATHPEFVVGMGTLTAGAGMILLIK